MRSILRATSAASLLAFLACSGAPPDEKTSETKAAVTTGITGTGTLVNQGKCFDVPNWNVANGTRIDIWDCNGGTNQNWVLGSDGTIRPAFNTNKCLDLPDWQTANGTFVDIWDCNGGTNQQWTLGTDSTLRGYGGDCIDNPDWQTGNGTDFDYWTCNGGSNQTFVLTSPPPVFDVIPPTTYTISMWAQVNDVREPTAGAPQPSPTPDPPGTCWPSNVNGSCTTDGVCSDFNCYTTDSGYQFWGELAAQVSSHGPTGASTQNAVSSSCLFATPPALGVATWDTYYDGPPTDPNAANITTCAGDGEQNGGANGAFLGGAPLTLAVKIGSPTDTIVLASVLDNVEQTPAPNVPLSAAPSALSQFQSIVSAGAGPAGSAVKLVYAGAEGLALATSAIGTIPAVVGAISSVAGLLWPTPTNNDTPGQVESCVGGVFSVGGGQATDTLLMNLTGEQLDAAAQSGVDLQFHSSGGWAQTSDGADHCSSNITIHMSVSRQWATGLAAAPRSGDFAIVNTPTQMNAFVVPQTQVPGPTTAEQFVGVSGGGTTWTSPFDTQIYNQFWNEGGVTAATTGALVQTSPSSPSANDEFFFWADDAGSMHEAPFNHSATPALFYNNLIFNRTYQANKICRSGIVPICTGGTTENLLPNNAKVTAVSRASTNLDAFFIDAQGNLWNVYSGDSGKTWGSTQITNDGAGAPGSQVSAVAQTATTLDVFFLGKNGLAHAAWTALNNAPWSYGTVSGTSGLATAGGHLAAVAQTVSNLDVFFVDNTGKLWRAYESTPTQPTLLAAPISQASPVPDGYPGGPIAAVSRQPGLLDVVFRPWLEVAPTWYSMNAEGQWTKGSVPAGDVTNDISIVAPSSYELRVFTDNYLSDLYTTDWVSTGVPTWTPLYGVETLTSDPN